MRLQPSLFSIHQPPPPPLRYRDIADALHQLALHLRKTNATLRIYDPYYCEGSVVLHLRALGFTTVYNRNEDFYARIAGPYSLLLLLLLLLLLRLALVTPLLPDASVPEFDVLVSNPPFSRRAPPLRTPPPPPHSHLSPRSSDHMARALQFAAACNRPWLLLLPDFVARKSYYKQLSHRVAAPWFIAPLHCMCAAGAVQLHCCAVMPLRRYTFAAPRTGNDGGSLVDATIRSVSSQGASVFAAPFQCVWFLQLHDAGDRPRPRRLRPPARCVLM